VLETYQITKPCLVDLGVMDEARWIISSTGTYNCSDTWEALRDQCSVVDWWQVIIWHPFTIPKHGFILWLAMKDMLSLLETNC
jgi:hypothetical protein